jgi:hypothetical protein
MSMEMAVDTMKILVAPMPIYTLVFEILLPIQLVASLMEAFSLENLSRPVRDVV